MLLNLVVIASGIIASETATVGTPVHLVPDSVPAVGDAPLYWCSWLAQGRMWMHNASVTGTVTPSQQEAYWRSRTHEDFMVQCSSTNAFTNSSDGRVGWGWLFPPARKDLVFVLDNGWQDGAESVSKSLELSPTKFPQFASPNKTVAIGKLAAHVKALGWKGLGLWTAGEAPMGPDLIAILRDAGVVLLKFDGGDTSCEQTKIARQVAPQLVVEHGDCGGNCPLNSAVPGDGRWPMSAALAQAKALLCTDLFRTYDTVRLFSVSEVIDRQAKLIAVAHNMTMPAEFASLDPPPRRLFGGSGEPVVTSALGGVIQPMRGNLRGATLPPLFEAYAGEGPNSRQRQHREDEIVRLARWARIAPPFGIGPQRDGTLEEAPLLDSLVLMDTHNFSLCDDACVISHNLEGVIVEQGAPARVTRNGLQLPGVVMPANGDSTLPFVLATRYPGGHTFSVTTIGRQLLSGWVEPRANVTLWVPVSAETQFVVGVFGQYASLTIVFEGTSGGQIDPRSLTVLAQDLASDVGQDISLEVMWSGTSLTLPASVIDRVGLAGRSRTDDVSAPGLVVMLK
eukprot:m.94066 g.94066  ORF g.94066 m.94066 type:complete len:566 (+) comp20347_c0_seq2:54-1751(+)